LTLQFFQQQIGASIASQIKKVTFCGNDGDPIYCKDLVEICKWFKSVNPDVSIVIITNGSYKTADWWQSLAETLDHNDEVHWSIDGWDQESNEQYRVNSNWDSIVQGIDIFRKYNTSTYTVWASIAFRFNEDRIIQQKIMATAYGFDSYQLTKSTKFGSKYPAYGNNDLLEPLNKDLIASGHRFERQTMPLTSKIRPGAELKKIFLQRAQSLTQYSGICFIGNKGVFLNSQGEFYPCCWTATRYKHNQDWQHRFNLYNQTFEQIIQDPFWSTEFLKFNNLECKTKCTPDRLSDLQHTTEW
jgi:MoaA/NifB/PqqE/SkfB family radical SAM enzyme